MTPLGQHHPTADSHDMFPIERTYSEWLNSSFATIGVDMGGRFGGNITVVSTCQDCHMPKATGKGCKFPTAPIRNDMPAHDLSGGNTIVQQMALNLYPNEELDPVNMQAGKERSISMLQRAATLQLTQQGSYLTSRVINETGHKLPSGYPEGRRLWLNVRQFDADGALIEEFGHYEDLTADLAADDTKVYEVNMGIDDVVAQLTGLPPGESFHFVLNNVILKDNRIPPRGFTNAAFAAVQAVPVAASYSDGQYWDDTRFPLASDAASVSVRLYYQSAHKEYIEFLRDENTTNSAGDVLHEQWTLTGQSTPILMTGAIIELDPFADGDANADGIVDLLDFAVLFDCTTAPGLPYEETACADLDFDGDNDVDILDFERFQVITSH